MCPPTHARALGRVAARVCCLQGARVVGAAVGTWSDVVDDGWVGRVVEWAAAECARCRVGDDGRAHGSVVAVAWDGAHGVLGAAAALAWTSALDARAKGSAGHDFSVFPYFAMRRST